MAKAVPEDGTSQNCGCCWRPEAKASGVAWCWDLCSPFASQGPSTRSWAIYHLPRASVAGLPDHLAEKDCAVLLQLFLPTDPSASNGRQLAMQVKSLDLKRPALTSYINTLLYSDLLSIYWHPRLNHSSKVGKEAVSPYADMPSDTKLPPLPSYLMQSNSTIRSPCPCNSSIMASDLSTLVTLRGAPRTLFSLFSSFRSHHGDRGGQKDS